LINNKKVLSVITARSGSKGLKDKNIMPLLDKPMLAWPIEAAKGSIYIDRIILSTDSKEYSEIGKSFGAEVPFLRPANISRDTSTSYDALIHVIESLNDEDYTYLLLLEPTSPLTEASDIDSALEILDSNTIGAKSIVGITENVKHHPSYSLLIEENLLTPYGSGFTKSTRRQDLEKNYVMDGSLYISEIDFYKQEKAFFHAKCLPYITPYWKSFEVDSIEDYWAIEAILMKKTKLS